MDKSLLIKDIIDNKATVNIFTIPREYEKDDYINIIKKANLGTVVTSIKFLTECLQKELHY
ncbi:hypothetical protein KPL42_01255 [Clostridium gasigenes]|uniref:Uncharacterized protein n=1 Tax=Clostridium gasigenes TaxID=94869 RepID=A0A7X0VQ06_9CLOT|nr:hypothetical protein [Clostridium gasigenes]MBB6713852.1 hypothetical protein [Clostridium gasigenes]MBU3087112.1 hypothetical protein [Clostridium gasigenes]